MAQDIEIIKIVAMSGGKEYRHLKRLGLSVLRLDMEDLAKYAHQVCIDNIEAAWVGEQVIQMEIELHDLDTMKIETCGNLAYVSLYHADKKVREKAASLVEKMKSWVL